MQGNNLQLFKENIKARQPSFMRKQYIWTCLFSDMIRKRKWILVTTASFKNKEKPVPKVSCLIQS